MQSLAENARNSGLGNFFFSASPHMDTRPRSESQPLAESKGTRGPSTKFPRLEFPAASVAVRA